MKSPLIYTLVVLLATLVVHAQAPTPKGLMPAMMTNTQFLVKSGGLVQAPSQGPGIKFINAQTRVPSEAIGESISSIQKLIRLSTQTEQVTGKEDAATLAETALKNASVAAVVVIIDKPGQPALLIAPESRWAIVNVETLAKGGASDELLALRTKKEILRAFGYVMGAANSGYEACVMKPVFKLEELDALKGQTLGPDTLMKTANQATKMGIKPARMTTYRKACEEGWAPMPTNAIQKAVWEEVKASKK
jgi:hypothetical protein